MIELSLQDAQKVLTYLTSRPWAEANEYVAIFARAAEAAKAKEAAKNKTVEKLKAKK